MIISRPVRIIENVGTKLATCDPESYRVERDKDGHIYFSFRDKNKNVYVARGDHPNQLGGRWTVQQIFGDKGLLGDLKAAKFGASLAVDREHDELSLLICEKTTHSCVYTRCKLREYGNITNAENWYAAGEPNPSTTGYAKVGSLGDANESLCTIEHDKHGNAIVSFSMFKHNTFSVMLTKFQDQWLQPILIDQDKKYCWASCLYLDVNNDLHIAYESYKDDTVRHKQAPLIDCLNPAEWKSAKGEKDFDHALHHHTKSCRAFSMLGNNLGKIYFVGHTAPQQVATTDILYNILDIKRGDWLFNEKENCGMISSVGYNGTYGYPQVGILAKTPVVVYTREGSDGQLHVTKNLNEIVYMGPSNTYYPCLERENERELNVIFTKKTLFAYDILGLTIHQT